MGKMSRSVQGGSRGLVLERVAGHDFKNGNRSRLC